MLNIREIGNLLYITNDDGTMTPAYPISSGIWQVNTSVATLQKWGNLLAIVNGDGAGTILLAYPSGSGLWLVPQGVAPPPAPSGNLIDTISSGYSVTNPPTAPNNGTAVSSGWAWHVANNSGRGGVDWNYSYGTAFKAPGAGNVTNFDVTGVGMVIQLILDTPVARTLTQEPAGYDQVGPIVAIFFQHCSAAVAPAHYNQNDIIGYSGNGYGQYYSHLHVHGMIDTTHNATNANRCQFWDFL